MIKKDKNEHGIHVRKSHENSIDSTAPMTSMAAVDPNASTINASAGRSASINASAGTNAPNASINASAVGGGIDPFTSLGIKHSNFYPESQSLSSMNRTDHGVSMNRTDHGVSMNLNSMDLNSSSVFPSLFPFQLPPSTNLSLQDASFMNISNTDVTTAISNTTDIKNTSAVATTPAATPTAATPAAAALKQKTRSSTRRRANSVASSQLLSNQTLQQQQTFFIDALHKTMELIVETSAKLNENLVFLNDRINLLYQKVDVNAKLSRFQIALHHTSDSSFQYYSDGDQIHDSAPLVKSILLAFISGNGYYLSNSLTAYGTNKMTGESMYDCNMYHGFPYSRTCVLCAFRYGNWVFREKLSDLMLELCQVETVYGIGDMNGYQIFYK